MVVKLGSTCCLHLSPPFGSLYSPLLSPSRIRCRPSGALAWSSDPTAFLGSGATKLFRSRSVGDIQSSICRSTSLSSLASDQGFFQDDSDDEDEFVEKLRELAAQVVEERSRLGGRAEEEQLEEDVDVSGEIIAAALSSPSSLSDDHSPSRAAAAFPKSTESVLDVTPPKWVAVPRSLPDWRHATIGGGGSMVTSSSCSGISGSLATMSRNKPLQQSRLHVWDDGQVSTSTADDSTSGCSVKRAVSSLVFIIRELHSHTLQLRELLFCEELQLDRLLGKVSAEVHASFCWLFQQIFSCTPTLMISVMLLMANFTVYSMAAGGIGPAAAATTFPSPTLQAPIVSVEYQLDFQDILDQFKQPQEEKEDVEMLRKRIASGSGRSSSSATSFSFGKSSPSVTANGGDDGGGSSKPVAGATDDSHQNNGGNHESSGRYLAEEEARAWRRIQDEASKLVAETRHDSLTDSDTLRQLVAPVSVPNSTGADAPLAEYMRTELEYRMAVDASPENPLLLANYAQFLFLVARDHDRAEHYFKRAAAVTPRDAESLVRYADFLWLARNDVCTAEETYLEALEADPGNACYAASYAHFLWNTGGEDTCFPLGDQYCQDQEEAEDDEHDTYHDERSTSSA